MRKITFFKMMLVALVMLLGSGSVLGQYAGTGTFTKITSLGDLTDGYYVVLNSGDAFAMNNTNAGTFFAHTAITPSAGTITNPATAIVWKIETNGGGRTVYNEATSKYVSYTGSSNAAYAVDAVTSDNQRWTFTYASNLFNIANLAITTRFLQYNASSPRFACYTATQQNIILYKMEVAEDPTTVATPTFSPVAGTYYSTQNVSISTETSGATIRYTTNGDEPTESSAVFSSPISVSATTTIKAKAYKTEMDPSATATATYVLPTEVANLGAMRSGGHGVYRITGEVLLTLKSATRNAKYVQDATGAVLIDDPTGVITTSLNIGDGITGLVGTTSTNNGMLNFTPGADPGAASTTNNTINPVEIELSELGSNEARLVKVSGVTINGEGNFTSPTNYNLNGSNNPVLRTHYNDLDYIGTAIPSVPQDIVGVVLKFNTTNQLVPRSLAEMTNTVFTSPTIIVSESSVNPMSTQIETTDQATITVNGTNLTGNITLAVTGTDASLFTLSIYSIAPTEGVVSDVTVTITYAPLVAGSHSALLTLSSAGAEDVPRSLSGTATDPPGPITAPNVIITEVYGGGGNTGAQYKNDFVELYNTTDLLVDISGWSVQYYSATGTSAGVISIPSGKTINPFGYFLLAGAGGATGADLPTPDATNTSVNISSTNGKVVLYTTNSAQGLDNSTTLSLITENQYFKDYVPFGNATPVWGTALGALSNTTSAKRKNVENVFVYTQDVGADFEIGSPDPQNFGFTSATLNLTISSIFAHNAQIRFTSTAGEPVEVYNAVGQKLISTLATDGQNVLNLSEKGVMIVKVGSRIAKVIL